MSQTISNSITRRSVVAGLALTAAPMTVLGGANSAYAQAKQTMPEKSLYERLGGVFAIAAVVDHFSDAVVKNPYGQNISLRLLSLRSRNWSTLITAPVLQPRPGRSRSRRSTATGSRVRRLSSSSTMRQSWHKWRAQLQPHSHRPRFARQLTQPLDGNNARDHPTSRDIAQVSFDAFA